MCYFLSVLCYNRVSISSHFRDNWPWVTTLTFIGRVTWPVTWPWPDQWRDQLIRRMPFLLVFQKNRTFISNRFQDISLQNHTQKHTQTDTHCQWFLPVRRYASTGNSDRNVSVCLSVRLSICLSVTRRYCVKMKKASVMISSPSGCPKTLVFWCQISSPNSNGFPLNGGLKEGWGVKIQRFSSFKRQYLENGSRYGLSYY